MARDRYILIRSNLKIVNDLSILNEIKKIKSFSLGNTTNFKNCKERWFLINKRS